MMCVALRIPIVHRALADAPAKIDFTLDVLQDLQSNLCVDTDRIYASGKSEVSRPVPSDTPFLT